MESFNLKIIDTNKILKNLEKFSSKQVCAMVKANAYGFGLQDMVLLLRDKVSYFGVASLDEALAVRQLAPDNNILIVGKTFDFAGCKDNDIEYAITDVTDALYAIPHSQVHLKIDSGMHRLGFSTHDQMQKAISILQEKEVEIKGIYTHFATLDCDDAYFSQQLDNFRNFLSVLPTNIQPIVHVGGSFAIEKNIPEAQMIRIGKGLYRNCMKISSRVVRMFTVKPGDRIGYSNGFIAKKEMIIGIVPLGYADGLKRILANHYCVQVNGKPCRITGNICMDMFAIDLTRAHAQIGDVVTILYDEWEMANYLHTSPYEVTTDFNNFRGKKILQ